MMLVACIFTCGRDAACLEQVLRSLARFAVPVCVFDDHLNPLADPPDDVLFYEVTTFNRRGNLNGPECVLGMLDCFAKAQALASAEWVIKIDSDTLLMDLDRALAMVACAEGVGSGYSDKHGFWGPFYMLHSSILPGMKSAAEECPNCLPHPEDQAMSRLVTKTVTSGLRVYPWSKHFLNGYSHTRRVCAVRYTFPAALTFGSDKRNLPGTEEEKHEMIAACMKRMMDHLEADDDGYVQGEPLLPDHEFEPLLTHLRGLRVVVYQPPGNVGDYLINMGTRALFERQQIDHVMIREDNLEQLDHERCDVICWAGGGNIGTRWHHGQQWRQLVGIAKRRGLPVMVLPHSVERDHPCLDDCSLIFAREKVIYAILVSAGRKPILVPDLALANYTVEAGPSDAAEGVFLRVDKEAASGSDLSGRVDPTLICPTPLSYIRLAARYEHIITDRLHFAIAALLAGRRATLLPGAYHKQQAMVDTWLRGLIDKP